MVPELGCDPGPLASGGGQSEGPLPHSRFHLASCGVTKGLGARAWEGLGLTGQGSVPPELPLMLGKNAGSPSGSGGCTGRPASCSRVRRTDWRLRPGPRLVTWTPRPRRTPVTVGSAPRQQRPISIETPEACFAGTLPRRRSGRGLGSAGVAARKRGLGAGEREAVAAGSVPKEEPEVGSGAHPLLQGRGEGLACLGRPG